MKYLVLAVIFFFLSKYGNSQKNVEDKNSSLIFFEAMFLNNNKNYEEAIALYEKVSFNDTNYSAAQLEIANCYYNQENFKNSQDVLNDLIELNIPYSKMYVVYKLLGMSYEKDRQFEKSIETYTKGIELFPYHYGFYLNRAIAYENKEKHLEAIRDFKQAIVLNPSISGGHFHLGMYAANEGYYAEAMLSLVTFILLEPQSERAVNALNTLEQMADLTFEPKSKHIVWEEDVNAFEKLNQEILNKTSVDKNNLVKFSIPTDIGNQLQFVLSNIKYDKTDEGFWNQFYVRFLLDIYNNQRIDELVLFTLKPSMDENISRKLRKKAKTINLFLKFAQQLWINNIQHQFMDFEGVKQDVLVDYNSNGLRAFGKYNSQHKAMGTWYYYHPNGTLRLKAQYDDEGVSNGLWIWYNLTNSNIKSKVRYKDEKADGEALYYYYSGELSVRKTFKDDKVVDTLYSYYRSGDLYEKYVFKNGLKNGPIVGYHENGQLNYSYAFVDGVAQGNYKEYYPNGILSAEFTLLDDKVNGLRKDYYSNGIVKSEVNYKHDVLDGIYKSMYPSGKLEEEKAFKEGRQIGKFTQYFSNGNVSFSGELDETGKENGTSTTFDYDGKKYQEQQYKKGELVEVRSINKKGETFNTCKKKSKNLDFKSYYPDGTIRSEGLYLNDYKSGKWVYYDRHENVESIEHYDNGYLEDSTCVFFSNGKLKIKSMYSENERNGIYLKYNILDTLVEEGVYEEGVIDRDWYTYNSDGNLVHEYYYVNGYENGLQKTIGVNGKLTSWREVELGKITSQLYLDTNEIKIDQYGQFNGEIILHDASNTYVRYKGMYKNGLANGLSTWYNVEGKVVAEGMFVNDQRDGLWKWYFDNGVVEKETVYSFGYEEGLYKTYYPDGKLMYEANYVRGDRQGVAKNYFPNGTLSIQTDYIDDHKHGKSTYFDQFGNINIIRFYDDGVFVAYSYLDVTGEEITPIKLTKEKNTIITYYKNGNKASEHTRQNGLAEGNFVMYNMNGKLISDENFLGGIFHGPYKEFDENGNLIYEANYKIDDLHGATKTFYPNGKVKSEIPYLYGEKHGIGNYYSIEGKLIKTENYYNDELIQLKQIK